MMNYLKTSLPCCSMIVLAHRREERNGKLDDDDDKDDGNYDDDDDNDVDVDCDDDDDGQV